MNGNSETPSQSENGRPEETPGLLYRKTKPWGEKPHAFIAWGTGKASDDRNRTTSLPARFTAGQMLDRLGPSRIERVILTGPRPGGANVGQWAAGGSAVGLPEGWTAGDHHLSNPQTPTLYYKGPDGRRIEVRHASMWVDDPKVNPSDLAHAFWLVNTGLAELFTEHWRKDPNPEFLPRLRSTPATTGRELLRRVLPMRKDKSGPHEYPALPTEVAAVLWDTAGQARYEMTAQPGTELPGLYEYDRRFAYAHGCRSIKGAGLLSWDRGGTEFAGYHPGRYLIEWTVPDDWEHVGILQNAEDKSWPAKPGEHGRGWADSREVRLALDYGWDVKIIERILFNDDGSTPLKVWADKIVKLRQEWLPNQKAPARVIRLAQQIARSILVKGVGSLQGRSRKVPHSADTSKGEEAPPDARMESGGLYVWDEYEPVPVHALDMVRPEWASQVWAEQRVKLLHSGVRAAQANAGALHIPRKDLVAFHTDAIMITSDPGWVDGGQPGQFRIKGTPITEPITCPANPAALADLLKAN